MMYPFLTLDDQTEIVHSEMMPDGRVKVYVETPNDKDCFHHGTCFPPIFIRFPGQKQALPNFRQGLFFHLLKISYKRRTESRLW